MSDSQDDGLDRPEVFAWSEPEVVAPPTQENHLGLVVEIPRDTVAVPMCIVVYANAIGDLEASVRFNPELGVEFSECLDLALSAAAKASIQE